MCSGARVKPQNVSSSSQSNKNEYFHIRDPIKGGDKNPSFLLNERLILKIIPYLLQLNLYWLYLIVGLSWQGLSGSYVFS